LVGCLLRIGLVDCLSWLWTNGCLCLIYVNWGGGKWRGVEVEAEVIRVGRGEGGGVMFITSKSEFTG